MANQLPVTKSFVKPDKGTTIVCPVCNADKLISVKQFRNRSHLIKVKCKCGNSFKVQLEFRRHYRKYTDLEGTYNLASPAVGGIANLINLSLTGVCFEVRGIHELQIGQKGTITFTLDNRKQTALFKNVTIRTIKNNRIGCEFLDDTAFEKDLGFYLRP
jgi:hypothetical protein